MAVAYEQARELVREHCEPGWTHGTFCLDDRLISENDEFYVFNVGAREFILGGDDSYAIAGGVPIVFKEDGRLASRPSVVIAANSSIRSRPNPDPTLTWSPASAVRSTAVPGPAAVARLRKPGGESPRDA